MLKIVLGAIRFSFVAWLLCGLVYPLAVTGLAQVFLPFQANGSLERRPDNTVLGSSLIGEQWDDPRWFHGRLSAITGTDPNDLTRVLPAPYNAANSGGSNLGPTSEILKQRLFADRKALERAQPELRGRLLPADMLTASASGLDPDISLANATLQASRVAKARGIPETKVLALLKEHLTGRALGIFGEPRVNVLELNLALEHNFQLP
jgi:potassium-transporting ATPase KdpC subunit